MATIAAALNGPTNDGIIEVSWSTLTTSDRDGSGVAIAEHPDKTVHVVGNFSGSAEITIEGSNDGGTGWFELKDITGTALSYLAAGGDLILENPTLIRPLLASGDSSADIDVFLVARAV